MTRKRAVARLIAAVLVITTTGTAFAEGRMWMDWSPIRDPAKTALEEAKAGKNDEFKAQIKELVTLTDEMNSKQADSKLDVAYETLVKIRDEANIAAATKMLEDFIPTLVDW
ncbi:MAG: hypothetical protein ACT4QB_14220 [Gammaproteobacteria bacterium]